MGVFVWEYGTGFKYKFTDHFGFRADLRGNLIQVPTFNLAHSNVPAYLSFKEGGAMSGLQATAGVSWYLGKVRAASRTYFDGRRDFRRSRPSVPWRLSYCEAPGYRQLLGCHHQVRLDHRRRTGRFGQRLYFPRSGKRRRLHHQGPRHGRFFHGEGQAGIARPEEVWSGCRGRQDHHDSRRPLSSSDAGLLRESDFAEARRHQRPACHRHRERLQRQPELHLVRQRRFGFG